MHSPIRLLAAASCLVAASFAAPRTAAAQDGGFPLRPAPNAQFVYENGEVVQKLNGKTTRLTQNARLPNGTKINHKSGMVELPGGKIITLRAGDYVKADGGVVYATPGSAAASRGDRTVAANAKFDTYVQTGAASASASEELRLLRRKVDLLTRKLALVGKGQTPPPAAAVLDADLRETDAALEKLGQR